MDRGKQSNTQLSSVFVSAASYYASQTVGCWWENCLTRRFTCDELRPTIDTLSDPRRLWISFYWSLSRHKSTSHI